MSLEEGWVWIFREGERAGGVKIGNKNTTVQGGVNLGLGCSSVVKCYLSLACTRLWF
jgi:hypothetical protein